MTALPLRRIEEIVAQMAWLVLRHGDVYAPLLERLEHELQAARTREPPADRARRLLAAVTTQAQIPSAGAGNAIRSSHSRL